MQNTMNKIFFWAFVPIWCALIIWNLISPAQEFSEAENRYLKAFPVFTSTRMIEGDFTSDINAYLNDHFAGRPAWVTVYSLSEYAAGKREINSVFLGSNAMQGDIPPPDGAVAQKNAAGISAFAQETGLPVYVMLVPSSTSIQPNKLPPLASGWDEPAWIADIYAGFPDSVTPVDAGGALRDHGGEYIYYRTDHHWTTYGAFLAYEKLADALGFEPKRQGDFTISTASADFLGTFHSKTGFPLVKTDTIEVYESGNAVEFEIFDGKETAVRSSVYFNEYLTKKDKYSYFLGQVQPAVTIRTGAGTGKKLLVFKDSYAHCLAPMLFSEYDEIKLLDLRFLSARQFDELIDADEFDAALFLYGTDVFSHQPGPSKLLDMAA